MKPRLQLTTEEAQSATLEISHQYIGDTARIHKFEKLEITRRNGITGWLESLGKSQWQKGILKAKAAQDYKARYNPPGELHKTENGDDTAFRLHFTRDGQALTFTFSGQADMSLTRDRVITGRVRWLKREMP